MKQINWQAVYDNLARSAQALQTQQGLRPELLAERARRLARPGREQAGTLLQILHLQLGAEGFALPLSDLQEVRSAHNCTSLPLSNAILSGIYPWRGQMVSVLNLAMLLGLPALAPSNSDRIVFLRQPTPLGLRVSGVGEWEALPLSDLISVTDSKSLLSYTGPGGLRVLSAERLRRHPAVSD